MELIIFSEFDQGGTAIGESAEFLEEDAFDFALGGEQEQLLEVVWGFAGSGEGIDYLFGWDCLAEPE